MMTLKLLTLNIWHGGRMWENLIEFIEKIDPDIACFQEVYNGHNKDEKRLMAMDEFVKLFPKLRYSVFKPSFGEQSLDLDEGNAVFSKFEIKEANYFHFNSGYEVTDSLTGPTFNHVPSGMTEAKIEVDGKTLHVYSMHGVWDTHGDDTPDRDQMGDAIIKSIKGKENVILAGDTNLYPNTRFVNKIEEELEIKSVFGDSLTSTFNMNHKDLPGYATASVDMIFVSKNIDILQKEMPLDDVSDHRPLIASLNI